jgi:hypothetical protein
MALRIYKPTDSIKNPNSGYYNAQLADIFKFNPDYIDYAIKKYDDFAIDMEAFEELPLPTPICFFRNSESFEKGFFELYKKRLKWSSDIEEVRDIQAWEEDCKKYIAKAKNTGVKLEKVQDFFSNMPKRPVADIIPRIFPYGVKLLSLAKKFVDEENYQPPQYLFRFSDEAKKINQEKIKDYFEDYIDAAYEEARTDIDYEKEYFNAMTDGQLGDYDNFKDRGGEIDYIDDWAGK